MALTECKSAIHDLCVKCADLTSFATKLEEKRFLESSAVDAALYRQGNTRLDSVRQLINAVEAKLKADRKRFVDFLDILRSISSLEELAETLNECCGK